MEWSSLPKELLNTIFSFLTCKDLTSAVCVNLMWNSVANNDITWKEAMFNGSFPHHFSYAQKNIPWRQVVKQHFETKKNVINRRCVQFTLGTRCPTSNPRASIVLRKRTANGKYCLLVWELMEAHGYSYSTHDHIATELWDLKRRTVIRNYSQQKLQLVNEYLVEEDERAYDDGQAQTHYAKFDPNFEGELVLDKGALVTNIDYGFATYVHNEEPNNHLLLKTWSNWAIKKIYVLVFDLRTGTKIFDKTFDDKDYISISHFYGSKIVMQYTDAKDRIVVLDVLTGKEIPIKEPKSTCAMLAGNELWIASSKNKCLVKYNLATMERRQYDIYEISNAFHMTLLHGIIWIFTQGLKVHLIDVSGSKCRVLAQMACLGWDKPQISEMPNGAISCLSTSYAHILSFRDEDIELPIQVLQIETTGKNEILGVQQGDLNALIVEKVRYKDPVKKESEPLSVSSQTVFEDENQRYCVIFSYANVGNALNSFVDKMRAWIDQNKDAKKIEDFKTKLFNIVYFDYPHKIGYDESTRPLAFGPCWVIYETKTDGAWQRGSPIDQWAFFKTKLGLK